MVTDDPRAELDRLEAMYGKGDPSSGWDNFRWEVAYTFPALAAALHAQLQAQAYVVPEGAQLVVPPYVGRVGYVLVRGGHVAVQEVTP